MLDGRSAWDGDDLGHSLSLRKTSNPPQCQLSRSAFLLLRDILELPDKLHVILEVFWLKPWQDPSNILFGNVIEGLDLASQHASAHWRIAIKEVSYVS